MRIVIYARKSTESEDRQVQSLEDQVRALTQLAEREGLVVSEVLQESKSAKLPHNRPEFTRLMQDVEAGRVRGILTWSINRLSRNALDGGQVAHYLQTGRLDFIRTVERVYRPEDNALLMSIENGMAIAYIQDLARNVTRGMKGKVERGWCPYKAPIGYRNDAESREIVIDQERWGIVRRGWEMAIEGCSIQEISLYFSARNLTIRSRKGPRKHLSRSAVHKLFQNPFYMGLIPYKGAFYKGAHSPMLTEEEFERARTKLSARMKNKKPLKTSHIFAGTLTCAKCGAAVVGETKTKKLLTGQIKSYTYYHCSGSKGCARRSLSEAELAAQAAKFTEAIAIPRFLADWISDAILTLSEATLPERSMKAADLQREESRLESRLKNLTLMRLDGEISAAEFASARANILEEQDHYRDAKNKELNREAAIMKAIRPRLEAAVTAGEINGNGDPRVTAKVLRMSGHFTLAAETPRFVPDPVLAKIASFEPLRDGSEKPKQGDFVPANSVWWALVREIRTELQVGTQDIVAQTHFLHV